MITLTYRWWQRRRAREAGGPEITIKTYKGDRDAERGIEKMARQGWYVRNHSTRKAVYSLLAGVFTRKQIHTVTFVR